MIPIRKPRWQAGEDINQPTLPHPLVEEDSWDGRLDLLALMQPQGAGSGWLWPVEGYHTLVRPSLGGRVHPVTGQKDETIPASTSSPEDADQVASRHGGAEGLGWGGNWVTG